ncbi:MAG: methyltransferase type 11 [Hyphomicrobiales bacterium]|nr:methyltransferase type 11 [Hyphomicrobiales bacterium]
MSQIFNDGAAYERLMGRWSRKTGHLFLDWLDVPPGLDWLDVGCGNGAFTEEVIARCQPASIVGVDPSEAQLAFARSRGAAATYLQSDATHLPVADASVDVAVMALVISFVPDPPAAVREMKRCVRKGGVIGAYMWDFVGPARPGALISNTLEQMGVAPQFPPRIDAARQDMMREIWEAAGLTDVETRELRITTEFPSFQDFWESNTLPVGPLGTFVSKMDEAKREELKERVRAALPSGDGPVSLPAWANAVKGQV